MRVEAPKRGQDNDRCGPSHVGLKPLPFADGDKALPDGREVGNDAQRVPVKEGVAQIAPDANERGLRVG